MSLPGLLVTGTDTGVGKTRIAAAIAGLLAGKGLRVGVLKPVATGAARVGGGWRVDDAEVLREAIGGAVPIERVAPLVFEAPLAPPVAARLGGGTLSAEAVREAVRDALAWWENRAELMIVEGVGGLLCPLAEGATVADLATWLDHPLVVVARRGLGTLNHTLLTVEAARRRALRVAGVVLNGAEPTADPLAEATNAGELARRLDGVALLADVPHAEAPESLLDSLRVVDWNGLAQRPRW